MSAVYQRKKALIIGIDNYRQSPLKYCANDAEDLKVALDNMGFNVSLGLDCNQPEFFQKIDTFVQEIQSTDLTLFYFAGHGKQSDDTNKNYLLPSDYKYNHRTTEEKHLMEYAVSVQYITDAIDDKKCCITIYIFDCCRNFVRTRDIDMRQGLSTIHTPPETLIVYSCSPGKAALDETVNGRNGIFTGILLKHIAKPHNDIEEVLKNVARDVKNQTNGYQLPYRTTSLTDDVCLLTKTKQEQSGKGYSQKQLECRGRACIECGKCRDWYRHGARPNDGYWRDYRKRKDARCCGTRYVDHDGACHLYDSPNGSTRVAGVCECSDNF